MERKIRIRTSSRLLLALGLFVAISLLVAVAGCGSQATPAPAATEAPAATTAPAASAATEAPAAEPTKELATATPEPTQEVKAAEGQTLIEFWRFGGINTEHAWDKQQVAAFEAAHPDIKVKMVGQDWATKREKMITSHQQGVIADVVSMDCQSIPDLVEMGVLEPLNKLDPAIYESWVPRFVPEIWSTCMYDKSTKKVGSGDFYMLPTYTDMTPMLSYNTQMLKDAGFVDESGNAKPPKSWDELMEYAQKLTTPEHTGLIFAATKGTNDVNMIEGLIYANGGRWLDDNGKVVINDKGAVDVVEYLKKLYDAKVVPAGILETDYMQEITSFFQNKAAMALSMSWVPAIMQDVGAAPDFPYGITLFPTPGQPTGSFPPANSINTPTSAFSVTALSKHKKEAMELVNWYASDEVQAGWDGDPIAGRVPALKKNYEGTDLQKYFPLYVERYKEGTLFKGSLPMPAFPGLAAVEEQLGVAVQSVLAGQKDAKSALDEAAKQSQQILDELKSE